MCLDDGRGVGLPGMESWEKQVTILTVWRSYVGPWIPGYRLGRAVWEVGLAVSCAVALTGAAAWKAPSLEVKPYAVPGCGLGVRDASP
jgi:hypothetical protein